MNYPEQTLWSLRRGRSNPLAFLTSLGGRGDFVPFKIAGQHAFLLNRPDYIEEVLVSQASRFAKGFANQRAKHLLGNGLLTADGPLHADRRRLIQPAFARQRLEDYGAVMAAHAGRLRDQWREGDIVDIPRAMGQLTFGIIGETVVGTGVTPLFEEVRQAAQHATASLDTLISLVAPLRRVRREQVRLHRVVDQLLTQASTDSGSLLSLLRTDDPRPEARDQIRDDLLTILLAGHDTITNALTWTWLLLARNPEAGAKLREELSTVLGGRTPAASDVPKLVYTKSVMAEALRLYPPAWVLARRAVEVHSVDAGVIPKGALVLVSQYLMHRDRRYFESPQSFSPERWLSDGQASRPKMAYFPFGAGARSCVGEAFGWMEGVLLLATIAQRWRLLPIAAAWPDIDARITLRPKQQVLMRVASVSSTENAKETHHADQVATVSENASSR